MSDNSYLPVIGKDMLRNLIINLYDDSRTIFREYIQNACDAIFDAVKVGLLDKVEDGHVAITLNAKKCEIQIADNGTGIPKESAVSTLMDISKSGRNGIDAAGQYGIGRLVGGGYCNELVLSTSAYGEDIETTVSIDTRRLRQILEDDSDSRTAEIVMQDICSASYRNVEANEHYFKVILKGVHNAADKLLNEEEVIEYVRDVAPLNYTVQFKQLINNSNSGFENDFEGIRSIPVSVNGKVNIRKRYELSIKGSGDVIYKLHCFRLTDAKFGEMGWGWYAVTPFTKAIADSDPARLIRLRKHNISLDIDILSKFFKEPRGNKYFYGEIFATHPQLRPNSARNGLVAGDESLAFYKLVKDYFTTLHKVYYAAGDIKKKLERVISEYEKTCNNKETGFYVDARKQLVLAFKAFMEPLGRPDNLPEIKEIYTIYYNKYKDEWKERIDTILVNQESEDELEPSHETPKATTSGANNTTPSSDSKTPASTPTSTSLFPPKNSEPTTLGKTDEPKGDVSSKSTLTLATPQSSPINLAEICKKLEDAGYNADIIQHTRKIFGCMAVYCPPQNRGQLGELIRKTVETLLKK